MSAPDDVLIIEASLKSRRCDKSISIEINCEGDGLTSEILSDTSYATLKPCSTASSFEYSVQNRSLSVSTFSSSAFVSLAVRRRRLDRLAEACDTEREVRETSDPRCGWRSAGEGEDAEVIVNDDAGRLPRAPCLVVSFLRTKDQYVALGNRKQHEPLINFLESRLDEIEHLDLHPLTDRIKPITQLPERRQTLQQALDIRKRVHLRILLSRPNRFIRFEVAEIEAWDAESCAGHVEEGVVRSGRDVVDRFVEYRIV